MPRICASALRLGNSCDCAGAARRAGERMTAPSGAGGGAHRLAVVDIAAVGRWWSRYDRRGCTTRDAASDSDAQTRRSVARRACVRASVRAGGRSGSWRGRTRRDAGGIVSSTLMCAVSITSFHSSNSAAPAAPRAKRNDAFRSALSNRFRW